MIFYCGLVNAAEYNWKEIAKLNTPDIDLFLGGNIDEKSKDPLFKRLISNMDVFTYPDGVVLNDQTYFSKHGCRAHSCPEKGAVWINKKKKLFIGLIVHKYFEDQEIDVLIGTQMISKGLDFSNVGLVGILNADQMLHFPDFRAFERAFQMMCQVSGRAGRSKFNSEVILQTFQPDHQVLKWVKENNYKDFLQSQLIERQSFRYPPYYRLIHVMIRHKKRHVLDQASSTLAQSMRTVFKHRILGPEYPVLDRVKGYFQKQILVKLERELSYSDAKEKLNSFINLLLIQDNFKSGKVKIDVDPY